jgi:5'-nucleotidase
MDPKYHGVVWTGSGLLDLRDPDPAKIDLRDIARGLSRAYRFGGQTRDDLPPYSVAWHSLFCEAVADQMGLPLWARLQVLLHDAPEYVLGDMITPIKVLDPVYQGLESDLWRAVAARFDVPEDHHPALREIDAMAAEVERLHLIPAGAWDPAPQVPAEWAGMGERWIAFTQSRSPEATLSSALFHARATALIEAHASEVAA